MSHPDAAADLLPDPTMPPTRGRFGGAESLAGLAAVAGAVLVAVTGYAGSGLLALAMAVVLGLFVWGWPQLLQLPSPRGTRAVAGLGAAACLVAVAATDSDPYLDWLPLAAAGGVLAAFAHQLLRRDGRPRLVESVAGELTALGLAVCAAAAVAVPRTPAGADITVVLAAAAGAFAVVSLVGLPERLVVAIGGLAAVFGAALAAGLTKSPSVGFGLLLGLVVAVLAIVFRRMLLVQPTAGQLGPAVSIALAPLAAAGVAAYLLGRLFYG